MIKSKSIKELAGALAKAQAEFPPISKNRTVTVTTIKGGQYSYKYADLADILAAVTPVLSKYELSAIEGIATRNGTVVISTQLMHSSGEWIRSSLALPITETGRMNPIQTIGSIITYGRRYGVCGMLGISSEEDTDGNGIEGSGKTQGKVESGKTQGKTEPKPASKSKKTEPSGDTPETAGSREELVKSIMNILDNPVFTDGQRKSVKKATEMVKDTDTTSLEHLKKVWKTRERELEKQAEGKNG